MANVEPVVTEDDLFAYLEGSADAETMARVEGATGPWELRQ